MKAHTNNFKNEIKLQGKEIDSKITFGTTVLGKSELNAVTPSFQGTILKSVMKQLEIDSNIEIPEKTILRYEFGVKVNDKYEYINFGNYIVKTVEKQENTRSYKITCYDKMLYSMIEYINIGITYPITIRNYISEICDFLGLSFKNKNDTFANYNRMIQNELYLDTQGNSLGYTFRDVLDELAQATGSTICINDNDELEIRYINNTNDTIDEEFLKDINVNFGEKYGPVNSIVLSRSAESDNVYLQDEQSINKNGLCELKIIDNQIMNWNDRSDYLPDLLNKLNGLEYYLNDYSSTGITYYDLCDKYSVQIADKTYSCIMFNDEINVTQGLEENVFTEIPKETQTDYTKADKTDRKINQTYLIVDKQNQKINGIISDIGKTNEKVTTLEATTSGLKTTVSTVEKGLATTNSNLEQTNKDVSALDTKINGVSADFDDFKDNEYMKSISNLQDQIDGAIQFWNGAEIPTLNNYPANQWTTENEKINHQADIYTVIKDVAGELKQGKGYRFDKVNGVWTWVELTDNELSAVQKIAQDALNKANKNEKDVGVLKSSVTTLEQTDDQILARVQTNESNIENIEKTTNVVEGNNNLTITEALESNALEYHVKGKSEQKTTAGKNKFKVKESNQNGIKLTIAEDGALILNGTATANTFFRQTIDEINEMHTLSYTANGTNSNVFIRTRDSNGALKDTLTLIQASGKVSSSNVITMTDITIGNGVELNNFKIYVQLELGNTVTEYEPYTNGASPNPDYPSEIKTVKGVRNLFDKDKLTEGYYLNEKGTLTANANYAVSDFIKVIPEKNYYIPTRGTSRTKYYLKDRTVYSNTWDVMDGEKIITIPNNVEYIRVSVAISGNIAINIDKFQIEEGSVAHDYVPYGSWLPVKDTGKNKFNKNATLDNCALNSTTGNVYSTPNYSVSEYIYVEKGIYTCFGSNRYALYDSNYKFIFSTAINANANVNITIPNNCYIRLQLLSSAKDTLIFNIGNKVIPYEPYKENISYIDMSKPNLFDKDNVTANTYLSGDGTTGESTVTFISNYINVKANTNYTIEYDYETLASSNNRAYCFYSEDKTYISGSAYSPSFKKIVLKPSQDGYMRIAFDKNSTNIKIYEGQEPYYEFVDINDTRDTLEVVSGKFEEKIGKIVLTGEENCRYESNNGYPRCIVNIPNGDPSSQRNPILSNYFHFHNNANVEEGKAPGVGFVFNSKLYLFVEKSITTANDFKQWLKEKYNAGTPVVVYYILAEPKTYQLKPTNIPLFDGVNHLSLVDDLETNTSIKYLRNTPLSETYISRNESKAEMNILKDSIMLDVEKKYTTKDETHEEVANLYIETDAIRSTVTENKSISQQQYNELAGNFDNYALKENVANIEKSVSEIQTNTYTRTEVNEKLTDGSVTMVKTTSGTFDKDGLHIAKTGEEMESLLSNKGFYVDRDDENILTADNTGVNALNLHSRQYLSVGSHCRWEDFEDGVGAFYVE